MNKLKINPTFLVSLFLAWFASMFLPSALNRVKFSETLGLERIYENFFYLLFHQAGAVALALLLLLAFAFFLSFKKERAAHLIILVCLILYACYFIIYLPLVMAIDNHVQPHQLRGFAEFFWLFYDYGYIVSVCLGLLFLLCLFKYSLDFKEKSAPTSQKSLE